MLYISTSNGVFQYSPRGDFPPVCILGNDHRPGWFSRRARGFFGIVAGPESNQLLAASRERLGTKPHGKPGTDCCLHKIDADSGKAECVAEVRDVHDVHQIAYDAGRVYLSDTGKNRVVVHDLKSGNTLGNINVGEQRTDVNHINALTVHAHKLWIGLNNQGRSDAQYLAVPLRDIDSIMAGDLNPKSCGVLQDIPKLRHSHDLEPYEDTFAVCASHDGRVVRADTGGTLCEFDGWVRGIAFDGEGMWLGVSAIASRADRHKKDLAGKVYRYDRQFEVLEEVEVSGAGQVNDLVWLPDH